MPVIRRDGVSSSTDLGVLARPSFIAPFLPLFASRGESTLPLLPVVSRPLSFPALAPPTPSSRFPSTSGPTLPVSWRNRALGPSCCVWSMPSFGTRRPWPTGTVMKPSSVASGISRAALRGGGKSPSWGANSGRSFWLFGEAHGLSSSAPALTCLRSGEGCDCCNCGSTCG